VTEHFSNGLSPVAFSDETAYRKYDISVWTPDGVNQLTHDRRSYDPSWSPDHRQIAYARGTGPWQECCGYSGTQLWVMNSDGTGAHPVWEPIGRPGPSGPPSWIDGGRSLLFRADDKLEQLDLATGTVTVVLDHYFSSTVWPEMGLALSPDETQVATI